MAVAMAARVAFIPVRRLKSKKRHRTGKSDVAKGRGVQVDIRLDRPSLPTWGSIMYRITHTVWLISLPAVLGLAHPSPQPDQASLSRGDWVGELRTRDSAEYVRLRFLAIRRVPKRSSICLWRIRGTCARPCACCRVAGWR